jgi:hypothetical protein
MSTYGHGKRDTLRLVLIDAMTLPMIALIPADKEKGDADD